MCVLTNMSDWESLREAKLTFRHPKSKFGDVIDQQDRQKSCGHICTQSLGRLDGEARFTLKASYWLIQDSENGAS